MGEQTAKLESLVYTGAFDRGTNNWDSILEVLKAEGISIQEAETFLTGMSVQLGTVAHYLGLRGAFGLGDSGHDEAMKKAMKRKKALRKANGYSYP